MELLAKVIYIYTATMSGTFIEKPFKFVKYTVSFDSCVKHGILNHYLLSR